VAGTSKSRHRRRRPPTLHEGSLLSSTSREIKAKSMVSPTLPRSAPAPAQRAGCKYSAVSSGGVHHPCTCALGTIMDWIYRPMELELGATTPPTPNRIAGWGGVGGGSFACVGIGHSDRPAAGRWSGRWHAICNWPLPPGTGTADAVDSR
jgi:hypothetical protein